MVPPPDEEHDCGWKAYAKALEAKLVEMSDKIDALERRFLEKKSEKRKSSKGPPPLPRTPDPGAATKAREETQAFRARLDTEIVPVPVPNGQRTCAGCGEGTMRSVGSGKPSIVYEYVQPHFRKSV